ncbi:hypothetical protein [Sphingomonas sp.]|uniref:hypothetical protein n=1 Tax=Sphingomonas sp. TaxID=28214 RepID=UPI001B11FBF9|nr:hypothetical protein [Sphingomonas sp.]MBO9711387.1 hypothetical protein [Sphingomonas sp.]
MPIKDLAGPSVPAMRTQESMMRLLVRLDPELDWWPRWRARHFGPAVAATAPLVRKSKKAQRLADRFSKITNFPQARRTT